MTTKPKKLSKKELEIYILLMCANADRDESQEELTMIKSKVDQETFDMIYSEFKADSEDDSFEKIQDNINMLDYTNLEIAQLRKHMYEIFFTDCDFKMMERNLDKIMDNIIY